MDLALWQQGQPFSPVLLFELKAGGGTVQGKRLRLGLLWYDDAAYKAILEEVRARIGSDPEQLQNNWLGDVHFQRSGKGRSGSPFTPAGGTSGDRVCSICGAGLRGEGTVIGLCGYCRRKVASG